MSERERKATGRVHVLVAVQPTDEARADRTERNVTKLIPPRRNPKGGTKAEFRALARQFIQGDGMAVEKTKRDPRPLCYEHHVPMNAVQFEKSGGPFTTYSIAYACPVSRCDICYSARTGYIAAQVGDQSKRAEVLKVNCPQDGEPMYLAEVHPQNASLRLWRCGKADCQGHRTIEELILEPNDPLIEQYFRTNL